MFTKNINSITPRITGFLKIPLTILYDKYIDSLNFTD